MSYDQSTYNFAKVWLSAGGWHNEIDTDKLAELIDDLCRDFVADLNNEADAERDDDK